MSHPHLTSEQAEEQRTNARELSGCGASPPEIAKALKISQAEVLAFLREKSERRDRG